MNAEHSGRSGGESQPGGPDLQVDALLRRAQRWAEHDPSESDRETVEGWLRDAGSPGAEVAETEIAEPARARLREAFAGPLEFGTAGLRGPIGPGESAMNRATVIRATAGLCAVLPDLTGSAGGAGAPPRLVVGYDARHHSARFARDVVEVAGAAGCEALLLPGPLPTPILAFAVRHLEADAGVMITASHNPAADNGYKVYLGGRAADGPGRGVQIVPPVDAQIAAAIAAAPPADEVPRSGARVRQAGDDIIETYLQRAASVASPKSGPRTPRTVVLTAMHGVGGFAAHEALLHTGIARVHLVAEQAAPDPDFPTVPFPNPEEPGALDLAIADARRVGADLVVALDPDADRCAVAIPDPRADGGWRRLTGDELGALLGEDLAARANGVGVLANSIVSGRLLARIAAHHGLAHATTLTGFKWIARVDGLIFGYEEAIGYCTDPQAVRDKDGITTAVRVVDLAARLATRNDTLLCALDRLARRYGLHATAPVTIRVDRPAQITEAMARLRATPPTHLAGAAVTRTVDLRDGIPDLDLPATDGMLFVTDRDDRVVVRPSGTEPKLKGYLEVVLPCESGTVPHEAAAARLDELTREVHALLTPHPPRCDPPLR